MVAVRYIVNDVDASIKFYTEMLGFELDARDGDDFAKVKKEI